MIKVELHIHSLGGSWCALTSPKDIAKRFKDEGYGAIVVTNHYYRNAFEKVYPQTTFKGKIDHFFSLYNEVKTECEKVGIKTFFGAEVATEPLGTEYILLGFDKEFLYQNEYLYNLTQVELFALAEKHNILMYQTHPFRYGVVAGDPKYMHGAEFFNSHFHHYNFNILAEKFCEDNNLVKISGNDFHAPDQPIIGGAFIPEDLNDEKALAEYLKSGKCVMIKDELSYQKELKKYKEENPK